MDSTGNIITLGDWTPQKYSNLNLDSLDKLVRDFDELTAHRISVETKLLKAEQELSEAKYLYDVAKGEYIRQGIEGKNAETREANLQYELSSHAHEINLIEHKVARKRHDAYTARIEWDLLRYKLRAFEVATRLTSHDGTVA